MFIMKGKTMENTSINIARILYEAYPHSDLLPIDSGWDCCDLTALLERVTTHDIGDGLFRFIVVEIVEGGQSTLDGAIRVMEQAGQDIEAVLHALQAAKADFKSNQEESRNAAHEEPKQFCQQESLNVDDFSSYCVVAEYLAEQGRKIFTGHMNGGLWNGRCLDAYILSKKKNDKVAYEFLLQFGDQYAQGLAADLEEVWQKIKESAAAMLSTKTP
jgi:hypothetical protein